jgi:hypothetical protein
MEESKALEVVQAPALVTHDFMPVMSIDVAAELRENIIKFVQKIMVKDQDYGVIPGTSSKPVLLKPGAEKLCSFFGLEPEFTVLNEEADWTGERHGGEPFYYIRYHCRLTRNGVTRGVGEGSCNSWESKYRYRNANRVCPHCKAEAIIKGKEEYGGGWLCFAKKGGCGAKFGDKDKLIVDQAVGRVLNPDVADQVNTIQKMAQKRALVPATLLATSGSEFFTQDLEDTPPPEPENPYVKELNERKQAETRPLAGQPQQSSRSGDGEQKGAAESPAVENPPSPPAQAAPAPEVPAPLRVLFQGLHKDGYTKQAFDLLKARMTALSDAGEAEYKAIQKRHGITTSSTVEEYKACLLEMWTVADEWQAQLTKATDGDVPGELFSEPAKETTNV